MTEDLPDHSENSPSSAEGWSTCADYINANRGLPDVSSYVAAEGTHAHFIRDECLRNGEDASNYIGAVMKVGNWTFEWSEDDADLLQPGIDRLRGIPGKFYSEHRVDLTEFLGLDTHGRPQGGTLDAGIVGDDLVVVNDCKWGRGVPVRPKRNKQLMLYGLGFAREHGITDPGMPFRIEIDQPRNMAGGGTWMTTLGELLEFGEWIKERAAMTRLPDAPRQASIGGCIWCRRKVAPGGCGVFDRFALDLLGIDLKDLDMGDLRFPSDLTPERRRTLIEATPTIAKWLEQVADAQLADALAGRPTGGMKAVYGRRKPALWHDKVAAEQVVRGILGQNGFTEKLISPTQACKRITSDDIDYLLVDPLIKRGEQTVVLAPEDDDRPAVTSAEDFDELPGN